MFERFTQYARQLLKDAGRLATDRGDDHIGREHVFAALLDQVASGGDPVAAAILHEGAAPLDELRGLVLEPVEADRSGPASPPFTPAMKKVLEYSLREALTMGNNYIGAFHVLLALIGSAQRDADSAFATLIENAGLDLQQARKVARKLAPGEVTARGDTRVRADRGAAKRRGVLARIANGPLDRVIRATEPTGGFDAVLRRAVRLAGDGHVSTAHVLRAVMEEPDNHARAALEARGLTKVSVEAALEEVAATGEPDTGASRHVSINPNSGVIEIKDPVLAQLLREEMAAGDDTLMREITTMALDLSRRLKNRGEGVEDGAPPAEDETGEDD